MLKKISNALLLTLILTSPIAHSQRAHYHLKWCKNVGEKIQTALFSGASTRTYEEEKELLISGIKQSIRSTPQKNNFYFLQTLKQTLLNVEMYPDIEFKVFYLRGQMRYALNDLTYLDQTYKKNKCFFCKIDHSRYVNKIINRGLELAFAVPTDELEKQILNQTATFGAFLLDKSANRRGYSCARKSIQNVLDANNIISKRESLRLATSQLGQGC